MESKTKKKLGTAVGGVAAVGAAVTLTAGTFSYFSDSHTSGSQSVTTGTIKVNGSNVQSIKSDNWAPGETHTQKYNLKNGGSLKGHLTMGLKASGNPALKRALKVKVNHSGWHHLAYVDGKKDFYDLGALAADGGNRNVYIKVQLPNKNHKQNLQDRTVSAKLVSHLRQPGH